MPSTSLTYEYFYRESCYRQFARGLQLIVAMLVIYVAVIPFTPVQYRILPEFFAANGAVIAVITLAVLIVIRSRREFAAGCAIVMGSLYLADILVVEDITCSVCRIPFTPVYVVGYITLILLAMHQRSNPSIRAGRGGIIILSVVFALASSGMEFVDVFSMQFTAPVWWMVIAKLALSVLPALLISTVHSVAIDGFRQQLSETERINEKLMSSMRYIICGEIFGALVHDFRNTASEVYWSIQRLKRDLSGAGQSPSIDSAIKVLDHSAKVSEQFMTYLRMDPTAVSDVDVRAVLASVLTFAQTSGKLSRGIEFVTDIPEGCPVFVRASEYRLFSVFLNLVVNAMQSLVASNRDNKTLRVSFRVAHTTVSIVVADNGPGIAKEALPRIFTVFSTKDHGGGLGLYFVWRYVVDELGGTIEAQSAPYEETRFCVSLKLALREPRAARVTAAGVQDALTIPEAE